MGVDSLYRRFRTPDVRSLVLLHHCPTCNGHRGRLDAGALDDYLPFSQHEIEDADLVGRPLDSGPVAVHTTRRARASRPRAPRVGKTTVLWKAVEARSGQSVLYRTWSREMTAAAEEHFRAFAPADVRVEARDFATFLGEVCGADVDRLPLSKIGAPVRGGHLASRAPAGRTVDGPRRGAACRGAGDAARSRRALGHGLHPGRRLGTAERRHVPRPAGGRRRRRRPGGGKRAAQGGRTLSGPTRCSASFPSWPPPRRLSVGCGTASCRRGSPISTASSSTMSRT